MSTEGSTESLTYEYAQKKAADNNLDIRHPKANELFIDIDSEEDFQRFLSLYETFREHGNSESTYIATPSKSGLPRRHVVVTLGWSIKDIAERVLLQACLGSDRKRELLSWVQIATGCSKHPTLFFEPKPASESAPVESLIYVPRTNLDY